MKLKRHEDFINEGRHSGRKDSYGTWLWFLNRHGKLNEAGEYDFDVTVNLAELKRVKSDLIKNGKLTIKFGKITGNFICSDLGLTSFYNFPHTITGRLTADKNNFGNLGGLSTVNAQNYILHECNLTSLEGSPKRVNGGFLVSYNPNLGDLKGSPEKVGGAFRADGCGLSSLEGAPKEVNDFVTFVENNLLRLEYMPYITGTSIGVNRNDLRTLKHFKHSEYLETVNLEYNPNLETFYGLEKKEGKPYFQILNVSIEDDQLITETEKNFVQYVSDFNKEDYWHKLLEYAINTKAEDIAKIKWPREFVEEIGEEKMKNLLKSGIGINKYKL
jgi:hypothetical protein